MKRIFSLLFTIILTTSVLTGCSINDFSENYGSYDTSNVVTIARTAAAPAPIATVPKPPVTEKNVETPAKITSNNAVYTTEPAPATDRAISLKRRTFLLSKLTTKQLRHIIRQ